MATKAVTDASFAAEVLASDKPVQLVRVQLFRGWLLLMQEGTSRLTTCFPGLISSIYLQ